jgi:hypothetical protein
MESKSILPAVWNVPQVFRDRLGSNVGRQRVMMADGHLLLVLHSPPEPDEDQRAGRFFWRQPDGTWSTSEEGNGLTALGRHFSEYEERAERLDDESDGADSADAYFAVLEALAPLHRAARNLHHVLQEARTACPADRDILNFRDRAYNLERTAELSYENTKNLLDFAVVKRAEEEAQASRQMAVAAHRLNTLAALFFPIATLSALFGMNLKHGLEETPGPLPFLGMVLLGLMIGIGTVMLTNAPIKTR